MGIAIYMSFTRRNLDSFIQDTQTIIGQGEVSYPIFSVNIYPLSPTTPTSEAKLRTLPPRDSAQ